MADCNHINIVCLNQFEYIRKYLCLDCNNIMMCECDREFAIRYLPHQLDTATDYETKLSRHVTLGFQPNICNECRNLSVIAAPKAEIYGATTKIKRYYWREIAFKTIPLFANWAIHNGYTDWLAALKIHQDKYKEFEKEAVASIREMHEIDPKYEYENSISFDKLQNDYDLDCIDLEATYHTTASRKAKMLWEDEAISAEEFGKRFLETQGYSVLFTESTPFHVLFGVFLWSLIEHYNDERQRISFIPDRIAAQRGEYINIGVHLPEDFGSPHYAKRRSQAIQQHFSQIKHDRKYLLWLFDLWLPMSNNLRQYLWAYEESDINTAREIIKILKPDYVIRILRYLVGNYWGRYLGWPDLLAYKDDAVKFVEVKSSNDKLSEEQKRWIVDNSEILGFDFSLLKIHKHSRL